MPRFTPRASSSSQPTAPPDTVSPLWLVKAIVVTIIAALFCGYLTYCYLFYLSQWQLVLHPARTTESPSTISGIPLQIVHFGLDESATPQLTGWWIPSSADARYAGSTIFFLPGGDGSLQDSIPTLTRLHSLGINIFAFDYCGYGQSASTPHPSQENLAHDADSAWQYITTSRSIPEQHIVLYGTGVGASLAARLAASHASIPAVILESPHTDLLDTARKDPRTRLLPVRLLFHENFPLSEPLSTLRTPKLLISRSSSPEKAFRTASDPKMTVELPASSETLFDQALVRFLDQYVARDIAPLVLSPAPSATNPH